MSTFVQLKKLVSENLWGFDPSRQVKSVHFANAFFRSVCGQKGDIDLIQKAAAGYRSGKGLSNVEFISTIRDRYIVEDDGVDIYRSTSNLRSALDLVLSQDKALFPNFNSSITLTHFWHTSSDPSDNGTGEFLAQVLAESEYEEIIEILRNCLNKKNDNIYLLTGPLLIEKELGNYPTTSEKVKLIIDNSPHLKSVQKAFFRLVKYEKRLEKTVFLQRVVILGCFALFLHLINKKDGNGISKGLAPIFITSADPTIEVKEASRSAFSRGRQNIEASFEEGFQEQLRSRGQDNLTKEQYIDLMKSWLPNMNLQETGNKENTIWYRFIEDFEGNLFGTSDISEAFQKACVRAAFTIKESPESFCQFIGKNIGLVYPREGGRGEKYYSPGPQFLDTLVVALLEPDEEITIEEFWERAWQEFGIICGAKSTIDTGRLGKWGIRQVTPKQLSQNARKLSSELIKMGYVREYADDIAMIRGGGISE